MKLAVEIILTDAQLAWLQADAEGLQISIDSAVGAILAGAINGRIAWDQADAAERLAEVATAPLWQGGNLQAASVALLNLAKRPTATMGAVAAVLEQLAEPTPASASRETWIALSTALADYYAAIGQDSWPVAWRSLISLAVLALRGTEAV